MTLALEDPTTLGTCCRWAALLLVACSSDATGHTERAELRSSDATSATRAADDAGSTRESDGEHCATLNERECRADALCRAVQAAAFDAERACQASRYAGCYRRDVGCTDALVSARGSDGRCWLFYDGCLPPGYDGTNSQDPACGYATFDNAPECDQ